METNEQSALIREGLRNGLTYPQALTLAKKETVPASPNDILAVDAGNAAILMAAGMHCIGCLAAAGESLEEAAAVHGLDAEELEQEINDYLAKKEAE